MRGRVRRVSTLKFAVVLPLLLASGGCAAANAAWRAGPAGIAAEWTIRDHLVYGRPSQAWDAMRDKQLAPTDALLRHMYRGVIALHAGEYEAGSKSMDRAWAIVDDRFTKRVSTAAYSIVTSDATLPYLPGTTEHLFIPYYGALNWLARNEFDETAVEARRLALLLQNEDGVRVHPELEATLRYVTGVLFEAAGERQDAVVAYRNAAALVGTLPLDTTFAGLDSGDVVVFLEDGFVGRPEPEALGVYMNGDELVALTTGDDNARLAAAEVVRRRRFDNSFDPRAPTQVGWLTYEVNWASFGEGTRSLNAVGARAATVAADSAPAPVVTGFQSISADVTRGAAADFERGQGARLSRAIARTAVRYAAMRAADKALSSAADDDDDDDEKGGIKWGRVLLGVGLGALAVSSTVIDQPDLRAWQLLPHRLTVARLRLPVGDHPVEITRGDEVVSLGTVTVRPGRVTVLSHRWWPGPNDVHARIAAR